MPEMNLLITGGAGFIGAHLVRLALRQPEVARLVNLDCLTYAADLRRLQGAGDDPRYVFEKVDLRHPEAVARVVRQHEITHVVHLAAETHVDRSIAHPGVFVESNVMGTFNLINACRHWWRDSGGGRFLQVSTDEVYGSLQPDEPPFTETSPLRPNSPYAASKAGADCLVRSYGETFGMPVMITRCSNNYGPGQYREKLIPTVVNSLHHRQPIPIYGDGNQVRDWLHVEDHCEALWHVLSGGKTGKVYNVGACNEWSNLELVRLLCDLHDHHAGNSPGVSHALIQHVRDRQGHDRRYALNSAKLQAELTWLPVRGFRENLQSLISQV